MKVPLLLIIFYLFILGCSQIEKKKFFPVFLLTGFTGFDGGGW